MREEIIKDFMEKDKEALFSPYELRFFWTMFYISESKMFECVAYSDRDLAGLCGFSESVLKNCKKNLSLRKVIAYQTPKKRGGRSEQSKTKYFFCATQKQKQIPQEFVEIKKVENKVKKDKPKTTYLMKVEVAFKNFYKENIGKEYIMTNFSMFRKQINDVVAFIKSHLAVNLKNENPSESDIVEVFERVLEAYLSHWSFLKNKSIRIEMINKYLNDLINSESPKATPNTLSMKASILEHTLSRLKELEENEQYNY